MAMEGIFDSASELLFVISLPMGTLIVGIGALILLMRTLSTDPTKTYGGPFMMILMGAIVLSMPFISKALIGDSGQKEEPSPEPSSTPSPTSTSEPSPEPTKDPVSLPEIENVSTIFIVIGIILGALLILFVAYLIIKRLHRDRAAMKMQRKLAAKKEAQLTEKWGAVTKQHDQLKKRVLGAETDWDMLFRYPVLSDVSYPSTAKLYEAMKAADLIDSTRPSSVDEDTDVSTLAYPKAVSAFKLAWDVAMRNARKIGQDDVPVEERRKIKQIRDILALAENAGSSQNERTMAYNRAYSMIKELRSIQVPDAVMHSIEEKKRLMIEAMEIEIITT